jgi:hypothetical protein
MTSENDEPCFAADSSTTWAKHQHSAFPGFLAKRRWIDGHPSMPTTRLTRDRAVAGRGISGR